MEVTTDGVQEHTTSKPGTLNIKYFKLKEFKENSRDIIFLTFPIFLPETGHKIRPIWARDEQPYL